MASLSFARQSQPIAAQRNTSRASTPFMSMSRFTNGTSSNDPLQPLRAMADRVGKEVEKFAERVDHWHTHGKGDEKERYQTTVKMVGRFRDLAESQVKELKKVNNLDQRSDLTKSVRRRVRNLVEDQDDIASVALGQSHRSIIQSIESGPDQEPDNVKELRDWQEELATWELVRIMVEHYHKEPGTDAAEVKAKQLQTVGGTSQHCKNSEIWDRFLIEDDQAKEKALVLRWLEQTARNGQSGIGAITQELEQASGKDVHTWTNGWQHTKSQIKQAKRMEGMDQPLKAEYRLRSQDKTTDLVTQLDPDVVTRQKRALDKSDDYYERALWMVCYEMMRRGAPWKDVVDYCLERNEAWRGVSLGVANDQHANGVPNIEGPSVGFLFRRMCLYAARGARNSFEGAVYGMLSGDLKQVQSVSRSWDDHLYAHYNALLLSRFDTYLQQKYRSRVPETLTQKFALQDAVTSLGPWDESPQRVIALLKQQKLSASQSTTPIKLIQGALIDRNLGDLIVKAGVALSEMLQHDKRMENLIVHPDSNLNAPSAQPDGERRTFIAEQCYQDLVADPHALRILVHIFIIFSNGLGTVSMRTVEVRTLIAMENVICAYIEFLRITKRMQLIPLYAAQLLPDRAAHCVGRVLTDTRNSEEQRVFVGLLNTYGLDVINTVAQSFLFASQSCGLSDFDDHLRPVITNPIKRFRILEPASLRQETPLWPGIRIKSEFDGNTTDPKEEAVIEALQWYQYVGKDYIQTFEHLELAVTIFLLNGRFDAARRVIEDLSVESLSISRTEALCGYPFDILAPGAEEQDEAMLHEFRAQMDAQERAAAISLADLPDADRHREIVQDLREKIAPCYHLQQMVRLLVHFREWREEEDALLKIQTDRSKDSGGAKLKPDTHRTKEVLETIEILFESLIASISDSVQDALLNNIQGFYKTDSWKVMEAYLPDIVLAYLSVLQTASWFLQRESINKAMDVAVLVADADQAWLQNIFMKTGTMTELMNCLANVSKATLKLTEAGTKKVESKKRGSKGETLKIWDLGVRER